jgi:hypothetical protein
MAALFQPTIIAENFGNNQRLLPLYRQLKQSRHERKGKKLLEELDNSSDGSEKQHRILSRFS